MKRTCTLAWVLLSGLLVLLLGAGCKGLFGHKANVPVVAKWSRFEQSFRSSLTYANPLQDARLTVYFTSPTGGVQQVGGFWDGGATWRVRFSPDQPGRWTYRTVCSDARNLGLNGQAGAFLCSAALGYSSFQRHGPVRVSRDHRHFEHADGTPFFWLADTAWKGARVATPGDWEVYALTRAHQKFSVVQCAIAPGVDGEGQSAFSGTERIAINPAFFQRLDAKLTMLSRADLLAGVAPLLEIGEADSRPAELPTDQAILLVRYIVARWGADPLVWVLALEGGERGSNVARWKQIGQAVFGDRPHAPVVLCPSGTQWLLDEFRDQPWVDAFAYQSVSEVSDDSLAWTFDGPFAAEWKKEPVRPVIPVTPREDGMIAKSQSRYTADDVRQAAYWGLLMTVPAGVSYGAEPIAQWDMGFNSAANSHSVPGWRKAMSLPGATQMTCLANLMEGIPFWKLRPAQEIVSAQPGNDSSRRFIAAASTEDRDLALCYVPEDGSVSLRLKPLPRSPRISWFNPRTGGTNSAVAVIEENACKIPTPGPGDWLLMLSAEKP
ncbi:MAG TPA: DUF4038 domain-containing protein [Candidatus Acidoferrum sp.]|nr:DUF4038 domain-containing protein [Candidatus Acidoferrum sp.]